MAQRGGSVVSHLRIGEVEGSLVNTGSARFLLSLDESEGYRNLPFLSNRGRMYVNAASNQEPSEEVRDYLARKEIVYRSFLAAEIAMERGAPMSTNLALLGYFSAFEQEPVTNNELRAAIENFSPDRFRKKNLDIFDAAALESGD